jgi:uncharacterized protein
MRWKQMEDEPKAFVLVFETVTRSRAGWHSSRRDRVWRGATSRLSALFQTRSWAGETKEYDPACVLAEQVELLSLIGDIALRDGEPQVHAHAVVSRADGTAHGGHLLEARMRPRCELTESPIHLQKKYDREIRLNAWHGAHCGASAEQIRKVEVKQPWLKCM